MKNIILILFFCFITKVIFSQNINSSLTDICIFKNRSTLPKFIFFNPNFQLIKSTASIYNQPNLYIDNKLKMSFMYNYKPNEAFFCKKEYELEKKINFPIKFRLATFEYTYKLEYNK
jgi:hypothetical protein